MADKPTYHFHNQWSTVCSRCGAVVEDEAAHTGWHEALTQARPQPAPSPDHRAA